MSAESQGAGPQEKMPVTSHLIELRKRVITSVVVLFAAFFGCFAVSEDIFRLLLLPLRTDLVFSLHSPVVSLVQKEKALTSLVFLAPAEAFWVHMKVALIAAIMLTFPFLMYQIWRFISPGLLSRERRLAMPFILVSSGLFLLGTAFCFVVVLPFAMGFLLTYKTASLTPMLSVEKYTDFCLKFILAFGVIFELPVVIVFLTRMGVVTPKALAANRKYAVLLAFVAGAMLTPTPDAFNQALMAIPIILLYEGGIIAARLFAIGKVPSHDDSREERKGDG
jgi:sec-independent protein translocase protein TatC